MEDVVITYDALGRKMPRTLETRVAVVTDLFD